MGQNSKPLRENIYNKIIDNIVSGKISPGEKLTEGQLAKQFRVSRTPVREALLQLEKKGVIVHNRNVGAVVKKITVEQVEDIFNIISVLEGYAVETVVSERIGEGDLSHIYTLRKEMEHLAEIKNYFQYAEKDAEFHRFFVKKAKNIDLSDIVKDLRSRVYTVGLTLPFHIDKYLSKHKEIIDAISAGDPYEAGKLMKEHIQEIKVFLIEILKQLKGIPKSHFESLRKD
jgi:DNA-binding GntR family transcriptional regulator